MPKALSIAHFPLILIAGILGQKVASLLWQKAFKAQIPDTAQREVQRPALIAAGILEGILYKTFRMAVDRATRQAVASSTGDWPGAPGEGE